MVFADSLKFYRDTDQGKNNIKELLNMVSNKLDQEQQVDAPPVKVEEIMAN